MKNGAIKWDITALAKINRQMSESLKQTADDLEKEILDAEVIPKQSGRLEASQNVEVSGDTIRISYNTPYATRLYFHPEYEFSKEQNTNAQGQWLDGIFKEEDVAQKYAKNLKGKI